MIACQASASIKLFVNRCSNKESEGKAGKEAGLGFWEEGGTQGVQSKRWHRQTPVILQNAALQGTCSFLDLIIWLIQAMYWADSCLIVIETRTNTASLLKLPQLLCNGLVKTILVVTFQAHSVSKYWASKSSNLLLEEAHRTTRFSGPPWCTSPCTEWWKTDLESESRDQLSQSKKNKYTRKFLSGFQFSAPSFIVLQRSSSFVFPSAFFFLWNGCDSFQWKTVLSVCSKTELLKNSCLVPVNERPWKDTRSETNSKTFSWPFRGVLSLGKFFCSSEKNAFEHELGSESQGHMGQFAA